MTAAMCGEDMAFRCLTFDMRRGRKQAKLAWGRRLDGGVRRRDLPAGQLAGLSHPCQELLLFECGPFAKIQVPNLVLLRLSRRQGTQKSAIEERDLDVLCIAMKAE